MKVPRLTKMQRAMLIKMATPASFALTHQQQQKTVYVLELYGYIERIGRNYEITQKGIDRILRDRKRRQS